MADSQSGHEKGWQTEHQSMVSSAQEAVGKISPGQRVFIGSGCAQPQALVQALLKRAGKLEDIEIVHLLTLGDAAFAHKELARYFRVNSFFILGNLDQEMYKELSDYTPILLSNIPPLFRSGRLPIDVALIQVTEPNEQGMCSLGISVDITKSAAENAGLVIAQVYRFPVGQDAQAGRRGPPVVFLQEGLVDVLDGLPVQPEVPGHVRDRHGLAQLMDAPGQAPRDPLVGVEQLQVLDHHPAALPAEDLAVAAAKQDPSRGEVQIADGSHGPMPGAPGRRLAVVTDRTEPLIRHHVDHGNVRFGPDTLACDSDSTKGEIGGYTESRHRHSPCTVSSCKTYEYMKGVPMSFFFDLFIRAN